jgi:hypothetical protein
MDCGTKVPGSQIQDDLLKGRVPQCSPCVAKAEEMKANLRQQPKRPTKKRGKKRRSDKPWEAEESDESTQKDAWAGVMKVNRPLAPLSGHGATIDLVLLSPTLRSLVNNSRTISTICCTKTAKRWTFSLS